MPVSVRDFDRVRVARGVSIDDDPSRPGRKQFDRMQKRNGRVQSYVDMGRMMKNCHLGMNLPLGTQYAPESFLAAERVHTD